MWHGSLPINILPLRNTRQRRVCNRGDRRGEGGIGRGRKEREREGREE